MSKYVDGFKSFPEKASGGGVRTSMTVYAFPNTSPTASPSGPALLATFPAKFNIFPKILQGSC
jgi:hypothetical protein